MEKKWAGTTYGNEWMHKWLIRMLHYIDNRILYTFSAVFVIPVCLLVNPSGGITFKYFRQRHGYGVFKAAWKTYLNHCYFGQVVIDKFSMYAGKSFDIEVEGYRHFENLARKDEGFIQLSSHMGNYEIAGYSLKAEHKKINALVFYGEKESVMRNRMKLFSNTNISMIAIRPDMGHLFEIDEALTKGEILSMPADRIFGSQKKISANFLGAQADFPYGPFSIATMRCLEVIAVNVIKVSYRKFKVFITPLKYDKTSSRKVQISQISQAYVAELERILKMYPEQWYNYFEFWRVGNE